MATLHEVRGGTEATAEGRWRMPTRIDPLTYAVGLVAGITYALHGFDGLLSRDLGVYGYAGQQVAEGEPPYVGILNRAGPLAHLIPAIGVGLARVGGLDDVLGMRLLFMVVAVVCVCLVYLLGRRLFASRLAGLAAAAAFLSFNGFIEYATNGPREKTPMVLFLLCTLLAVAGRRWFAAGVSVSLATLVWQPALFVGLTAVAVALVAVQPSERLRAAVSVVVGGLIPASVCLGYFAAIGAVRDFLDGFVLINARYTEPPPFTAYFGSNWSELRSAYGVTLWVMLVGLAVLVALSVPTLRRAPGRNDQGRDPGRVSVAAAGVASLAGLVWSLRDFSGWPDAFVLLPLAAIGIGGLAREVAARLHPRAAVSATLAWVVAAVAVAVTYAVTERNDELQLQRDSVDAVLGELPPDASILSIEAPQPLVLSGSTNPTRHQMLLGALGRYVDDTWPGGLKGFGEWVGSERPTVIAVGRPEVPSWLSDTIATQYRSVGGATCWTWYVHRSVGPAVLSAVRDRLPPTTGTCPEW